MTINKNILKLNLFVNSWELLFKDEYINIKISFEIRNLKQIKIQSKL